MADLKAVSQSALVNCFAGEVAREFNVLIDAYVLAKTPDDKTAALKRMEAGLTALKETYAKASDLVDKTM